LIEINATAQNRSNVKNGAFTVHRSDMPLFIYRCPNTGLNVQGFTADDLTEGDKQTYEALNCTACKQVHSVNPKTGKVLSATMIEGGDPPMDMQKTTHSKSPTSSSGGRRPSAPRHPTGQTRASRFRSCLSIKSSLVEFPRNRGCQATVATEPCVAAQSRNAALDDCAPNVPSVSPSYGRHRIGANRGNAALTAGRYRAYCDRTGPANSQAHLNPARARPPRATPIGGS
jgi:hypothetical protein